MVRSGWTVVILTIRKNTHKKYVVFLSFKFLEVNTCTRI